MNKMNWVGEHHVHVSAQLLCIYLAGMKEFVVVFWLDSLPKNADNIAKLHVHLKSSNLDTNIQGKWWLLIGTTRASTLQTFRFKLMRIIDSSRTDNRLNWTLESMHDDTRWVQIIGWKALLSKRQKVTKMTQKKDGKRKERERIHVKGKPKQKYAKQKKNNINSNKANTTEEIWGNTWTFYIAVERKRFDAYGCQRDTCFN